MVRVPVAIPVTTPVVDPIVAREGLLDVHVPPPASNNVVVCPTHTVGEPEIKPGKGLTK